MHDCEAIDAYILKLESQLLAADELAAELRGFTIPQDPRAFDTKHFFRISDKLRAYDKARGVK